MEFKPLAENGPVVMIPRVWGDSRGYFMETFRANEFSMHCGNYQFVQDNQSKSARGVLRGLHYQLKKPQGKLVRVVSGRVYDVAVDLRRSSSTFGQVFGVILDDASHWSFWVPPGFAHGFLVLSEVATFVYKCTEYYAPEDEYCLKWDDPKVAVPWPTGTLTPILSEKDLKGSAFDQIAIYD